MQWISTKIVCLKKHSATEVAAHFTIKRRVETPETDDSWSCQARLAQRSQSCNSSQPWCDDQEFGRVIAATREKSRFGRDTMAASFGRLRTIRKQTLECMRKAHTRMRSWSRRLVSAEIQTEQRLWLSEYPDPPTSSCHAPLTNESGEDDVDYDAPIDRTHQLQDSDDSDRLSEAEGMLLSADTGTLTRGRKLQGQTKRERRGQVRSKPYHGTSEASVASTSCFFNLVLCSADPGAPVWNGRYRAPTLSAQSLTHTPTATISPCVFSV